MSPRSGVLLGTVFMVLAVAGFALRYREQEPATAAIQASATPVPSASLSGQTAGVTSTEEAVLQALQSNTPGAAVEHMTETVVFTNLGKGCCGNIRRKQTIPHFAELAGAEGPWTASENQTIKMLLASDPGFAENRIVFGSANGYAVAIRLTTDNLIEEYILVTPDIFQRRPQ